MINLVEMLKLVYKKGYFIEKLVLTILIAISIFMLILVLFGCKYQKQQIKPRFKVIANELGTYKSVECDSFYFVNQTEINYYVKDSQGTISAKELIIIDKYGI